MVLHILIDETIIIESILVVGILLVGFSLGPRKANVTTTPFLFKLVVTSVDPIFGIDNGRCFGVDHDGFFSLIHVVFTALAIVHLEFTSQFFICLDETFRHGRIMHKVVQHVIGTIQLLFGTVGPFGFGISRTVTVVCFQERCA